MPAENKTLASRNKGHFCQAVDGEIASGYTELLDCCPCLAVIRKHGRLGEKKKLRLRAGVVDLSTGLTTAGRKILAYLL